MTWAILASGQSLTQEHVDYVHAAKLDGRLSGVGAVSNVALDYAPWADFIASHDSKWWRQYPQALDLDMRKFCRMNVARTERFVTNTTACNSGLFAMEIAWKVFKAERLILLGFDMHGTHYFGPHTGNLNNTTNKRFAMHIKQFEGWKGPEVINCNPNSALRKFPFMDLYGII